MLEFETFASIFSFALGAPERPDGLAFQFQGSRRERREVGPSIPSGSLDPFTSLSLSLSLMCETRAIVASRTNRKADMHRSIVGDARECALMIVILFCYR